MKVTNRSKAQQGVRTKAGVVYIAPGQTKDVDFTESGLAQARRRDFLVIEEPEAKAELPAGDAETVVIEAQGADPAEQAKPEPKRRGRRPKGAELG